MRVGHRLHLRRVAADRFRHLASVAYMLQGGHAACRHGAWRRQFANAERGSGAHRHSITACAGRARSPAILTVHVASECPVSQPECSSPFLFCPFLLFSPCTGLFFLPIAALSTCAQAYIRALAAILALLRRAWPATTSPATAAAIATELEAMVPHLAPQHGGGEHQGIIFIIIRCTSRRPQHPLVRLLSGRARAGAQRRSPLRVAASLRLERAPSR